MREGPMRITKLALGAHDCEKPVRKNTPNTHAMPGFIRKMRCRACIARTWGMTGIF